MFECDVVLRIESLEHILARGAAHYIDDFVCGQRPVWRQFFSVGLEPDFRLPMIDLLCPQKRLGSQASSLQATHQQNESYVS